MLYFSLPIIQISEKKDIIYGGDEEGEEHTCRVKFTLIAINTFLERTILISLEFSLNLKIRKFVIKTEFFNFALQNKINFKFKK